MSVEEELEFNMSNRLCGTMLNPIQMPVLVSREPLNLASLSSDFQLGLWESTEMENCPPKTFTVFVVHAFERTRFWKKKNRKRYGTVNGDPLKRYAPEEKLRYGTVRVTNSNALLYFSIRHTVII